MTFFVTYPKSLKKGHEKFSETRLTGSLTIVHLTKSGNKN